MSVYLNPLSGHNLNIQALNLPHFAVSWLHYLLSIENKSVNTVFNYGVAAANFLKWYKNYCDNPGSIPSDEVLSATNISRMRMEKMAHVTSTDIKEYIYFSDSVTHNSATTRSNKLSALRSMFNYLRDEDNIVSSNPCDKIGSPTLGSTQPKYLTENQSNKLLEAIKSTEDSNPNYSRDFCIIYLLLSLGVRLSELVSLNLQDIQENYLRVYGKGRKERLLYLNDTCLEVINAYLLDRSLYKRALIDKDALFVSQKNGRRLTGRRVEQIVDKYIGIAGLQGNGISPHKLRHTCATLLYRNNGNNLIEISEILGHSSIQTTQRYAHSSDAAKINVLDSMEHILPQNAPISEDDLLGSDSHDN